MQTDFFWSIKQELSEKSFQGEDFRKLHFAVTCLQEAGVSWQYLLCATFLLKSKQNQNSASLNLFRKCLEKCTLTLPLNLVRETFIFINFAFKRNIHEELGFIVSPHV